MLRRSFLKACSAVSAMSVLGGVQAIAAEQCSRTFVDLYADWALSKKEMLLRVCEVNNASIADMTGVVFCGKQEASMNERMVPRMIIAVLPEYVWFFGRIRNEWGSNRFLATEPYHDSIKTLRNLIGHSAERSLQQTEEIPVLLPDFGEHRACIGGRSPLHGDVKAVILCMRGVGTTICDVMLSTDWDADTKYLAGVERWYRI